MTTRRIFVSSLLVLAWLFITAVTVGQRQMGGVGIVVPLLVVAQNDLSGTSWRLVKFQSSDDSTLTPDDRSKYTITFGSDGQVSARVDCNRGRATWESTGANQLRFGPLAITRAMCPPGSLHDRIVKDWTSVRSYVMKDGHLFLLLMADGGSYEYEPQDGSEPPTTGGSLFGRQWKLTEVGGSAVKTTAAYIEFDAGAKRFSGNGGCNRIAGNFAVDGTSMKFSEAISTKRACIDREVQQNETDFFAALDNTTGFELQGNKLKLYAGDRLLLTFQSDSNETPGPGQSARVTGTVTYKQRIALSPRALVEVKLLDTSRADARSVTIVEQRSRPKDDRCRLRLSCLMTQAESINAVAIQFEFVFWRGTDSDSQTPELIQ